MFVQVMEWTAAQRNLHVDINNLKAFIEVADKKSFSRSAETLKLTQPAVSKRIAALETELAARLFDRVGKSVHLTEAGRVLLPAARQISSELSRIEDVICNLDSEVSGTLSIGATEHVGTHYLPQVLKPFHKNFPKVDIDLHFGSSEQALEQVDEGLLEIALCSQPLRSNQKRYPKLRNVEVWSDNLVIAVAHNHPLVSGEAVSLQQLSKCPAILPTESALRSSIEDILLSNDLTPFVSVEADDFETLRTMASIGLGWACLPEFQVDDSLTVLSVEELKLRYSIALIKHSDRTLSRAASTFIESLPEASSD